MAVNVGVTGSTAVTLAKAFAAVDGRTSGALTARIIVNMGVNYSAKTTHWLYF
jgi:hypothetical protein